MMRLFMDNPLDYGLTLATAEKLIQLGARPPIVSRLCNLSRKQSIRFYKTIQGKPPKRGMLPYDHNWIARSAINNIHASLFLGIAQDLRRQLSVGDLNAQLFIATYDLYIKVIAKTETRQKSTKPTSPRLFPLDINRAWHLIGQFSAGDLFLNICSHCQARYLGLMNSEATFNQCPVCDVWTDRSGRRRWIPVKPKTHSLNNQSAR